MTFFCATYDHESGSAGRADSTYLKQAWSFMLNGGAILIIWIIPFIWERKMVRGRTIHSAGAVPNSANNLNIKDVFGGIQFIKMQPAAHLMSFAPGLEYYCLADIGKEYALYFDGRNQGYALIDIAQVNYEVRVFFPFRGTFTDVPPEGLGRGNPHYDATIGSYRGFRCAAMKCGSMSPHSTVS